MKKILVSLCIIIITIASGIYFIDKKETNVANNNLDENINYGVLDIPKDMETISNLSSSDVDIICATSKGLVKKDKNNEIVPELASEFSVSDDKIEYKFKIKDNIYWSDGSKITMGEIKDFFRELIKQEDEKNISALLDVYKAKDYREEKEKYFKGVAITSTDDSIVFRLNSKKDNFLEELTKPQYRLRKNLTLWGNIKRNYNVLKYSGDYKINSVDSNSLVLNKSNDNCKFDTINFKKEQSSEAAMASYEIDLTDIVIDPPSSVLNKLKDNDELITLPQNNGIYLVINDNTGVNLQGRRELYNMCYKGIESYHNDNMNDFELAETCYFRENKNDLIKMQERKVDSNKKNDWNKPSVITIIGEDTKINRILCRSIKEYFLYKCGITIKYSLVSSEEFKEKDLKQKYDMILVSNEANYSNKEEFYSRFEEYLTKLNLDILESDRINDYYGEYYDLESSIFLNYNILPLCFENKNIGLSARVSNLTVDMYGNLDFSSLN